MSDPAAAGPSPGSLPEVVRQRVLALAADAVAALAPADVPPGLKAVARFTPSKRARLGAGPLAATLESEPAFRQVVADAARLREPDLVAAIESGQPPPAADPAEVAALAYLLRPPGWETLVTSAGTRLVDQAQRAGESAHAAAVESQLATARAARSAAEAETARLRRELATARSDVERLRAELRGAGERLRRAEATAGRSEASATDVRAAADGEKAEAARLLRREQHRVVEVEAQLEALRRTAREAREGDDVRLQVLLDTIVGAAQGLRTELALAAGSARPADLVEARHGHSGPAPGAPGALLDDPARLVALLGAPGAHLIVDGYNVTKTGYPELPLVEQRARLTASLAALAARVGRPEVTLVFDGAGVTLPTTPSARGVRVLFSDEGEIADELIRRLVAAEPSGRPVLVVSSDREVAEGVRRSGALPVASATLLGVLRRA